jgi:outer membrane protein
MITRSTSAFIAVAVLLSSAHAAAGVTDAPVHAMTLREALDYARAHHPDLRAAAARVEAVAAEASVARARRYPTVAATAQILAATTNNTTGTYLPAPLFDNPRVSATRAESAVSASLVPSGSTLLGAGVRQLVYDFGRVSAEVALDDLRADAERMSFEERALVLTYEVEESYFAVHAAKSVLAASDDAYGRAVVHRDLARAGVDTGLRRPIELTRAQAVLDRFELGRIHARYGVTTAESVLAAAVGVPDHLLDIAGPPPPVDELPAVDAAFARAGARSPEIRAALATLRAQEKETRAIAAQSRPSIYLTGAISGNAGGAAPSSGESAAASGLLPTVPNWDVGLVLSWPLLAPTVSARASQSRAEEAARREEAAAVKLRVEAAVQRAYVDVQAARDALPVLEDAVRAGVANYEQADARFQVGLGNAVELADAEEVRTAAAIDLALGKFELARARAALGRAIAEGI